MLIVFEGIDGAGKARQIRMLCSFFRQHKVKHKLHKYPTKKAKEVFAHLSGKKTVEPIKLAEIFAQDILDEKGKIEEEIADGFVVICDRYLHSTLAYQGVDIGFDKVMAMLEGKNALVPELVILLDLPAKVGAERKYSQKKPDRFEKDVMFLEKVRKNYLRIAKQEFCSYKFAVVDAARKPHEIFTDVICFVEPLVVKKMNKI